MAQKGKPFVAAALAVLMVTFWLNPVLREFLLPQPAQAANVLTLLHEFAGWTDDGSRPFFGFLTLSGSTLYGMTMEGGDSDLGTIFSIGTNGSNYTLLHEFAGGTDDGASPFGSLTLSGSTLYGMTSRGGDSDLGTIFSIGTNGSNYTLLHEFAGGPDDGRYPYGSLILSGSTLYGMTSNGGDDGSGTIFSINTDGTGFTLLHEFAGGPDDGRYPYGSLTLSGSTLYGMTSNGGDDGSGTIFSINTDGTGFTLLHEFAGGPDDGRYPYGSLTLSGSTLYGTTVYGGDGDLGTVFSYTFSTPTPTPTSSHRFSFGFLTPEARARLARLLGYGTTPTPSPSPAVLPAPSSGYVCVPSMYRGMRGEAIRGLQTVLKRLGFFPADVDPTGFFGPVTQSAVKAFQTSRGISPIGIVGPLTCAALNGR